MKTNYFKQLGYLLLSVIFFISCKKESIELPIENFPNCHNNKNECRLLSTTSEFANLSYSYNQKGLVGRWNVSYLDGYLTMEYDLFGRLVKSKYYSKDVLVNTIVFSHHGERVVKETWYDGDTQNKTDEVFYSYNSNGKVWKSQSFIDDYYSFYTYTPDGGSVDGWKLYVGGILNYEQHFTYLPPHHKDPGGARPGLDYDFTSPNGWVTNSRWYSTSEKDISYDENGENPEVLEDQDPAKSIIKFNRHNYITVTDFFDNLTQEYTHFKFVYENCGNDDGDNTNSSQKQLAVPTTKINPLALLRLGSAKSIKDQLKEIRGRSLSR